MTDSNKARNLSRRGFLKTLGIVSAGFLARPAAIRASNATGAAKVGVLIPRSSLYPWLGDSFTSGLRLGIQPSGAELIIEDTGTRPSLAVEKCRRLVREIKADLIIALANTAALNDLKPTLRDTRTPLILATAGAVVEQPRSGTSSVLVASLDTWQSHWALGAWSARNLGTRAMVAASMHESGYDSHYAFQMGFESEGGEVIATRVTDAPFNPGGVHAFLSEVERLQPDVVFANYSGHDALPFMRAWANGSARAALVGSPFFVDENVLLSLGVAALGVRSVFPWAPGLNRPGNADFVTTLRKGGRTPDAFSMLGFECGQAAANWAGAGRLTASSDGPRHPANPLYLREVTRRGNEIVAELGKVDESHARILALRSGVRTGWTNTYLSV